MSIDTFKVLIQYSLHTSHKSPPPAPSRESLSWSSYSNLTLAYVLNVVFVLYFLLKIYSELYEEWISSVDG